MSQDDKLEITFDDGSKSPPLRIGDLELIPAAIKELQKIKQEAKGPIYGDIADLRAESV